MKSMIYLVVGLFVLSSFATIGIGEASQKQGNLSFTFSEPTIVEKDSYVQLNSEGTDSWIFDAGSPMLPRRIETLTLPFGTTVTNVVASAQGVQTKVLSQKIEPAPQAVIEDSDVEQSVAPQMNEAIYNSNSIYPNDWVAYHVGAGLDENNQHVTFLTINTYPVRYNPTTDMIYYADNIEVTVTYDAPDTTPFPANTEYQLVIIAPAKFSSALQPLVTHKISKGISTLLKTTEDIYTEFTTGYDKPEQIKYFIKYALENYNTSYILIVGGLKSKWFDVPRDNANEGTKDWYVPVRYTNLVTQEGDDPGFISDLYYSDVYKADSTFCSWDSNGDHIYAKNNDVIDLYPDVALSRLPCRSVKEVKGVVDKIVHYETTPVGDWFNNMVLISGDGFQDQADIGISWSTSALPNGEYKIYAQSKNINNVYGPIQELTVTVDKTKATSITFHQNDDVTTGLNYPFPPVAEIVSVSDGDVLGNTDYSYTPTEREAYCNGFSGWANIQYTSGVLKLRGKTYDPRPYGVETSIHVWVNNSAGTTVFTQTKTGFKLYWEGEWTCGNQLLQGRAGAAYYMPEEFNMKYLFSSNGNWTGQTDVINTISEGAGFVFFSGHGNPAVFSNHYPGIPGSRKKGEVKGLYTINKGLPLFPMDSISNEYMNPVVIVGGCHNSQFNVSFFPTLLDFKNEKQYQTYGTPASECWSERFVREEKTGAIATIGNTGFGFGVLGEFCTIGGYDNYITTEFFVQYGVDGHHILGDVYVGTLTEYISHFKAEGWDTTHLKTVEQWVMMGDPSLLLGGYS
jgi:hypothetical protein